MKTYALPLLLGLFAQVAISHGENAEATGNPGKTPAYETIAIKSPQGTGCSAAFFRGESDQVVVFVPGAVFDKESWYFLAERLQALKIASLSLDGKTPQDVLSAIEFAKAQGFKTISLVGGSMGGAAILDALKIKSDEHVRKVILLAPAGGPPIANDRINKLFVVSNADRLGLYPEIKKLCEASSDPKQFMEYEGTEHAQHLFKGPHKDDLSKLMVGFLAD